MTTGQVVPGEVGDLPPGSTSVLEPLDTAARPGAAPEAPGGGRVRASLPQLLIGAACSIGLAAPALFTGRTFATDFTNNLWYVQGRAQAVEGGNWLSPFLHAQGIGVFSPLSAFYSGPLFSLIGALGDLLGGHVLLAFDLSILLAFAMAYGGLYWLARQCGVRPVLAHFPAICVLTSAYWITVGYGRGDVSELFGLCSACLVGASAAHLVRSPRAGFLPALLLVGATAVFCGSHNITLLWASVVGVVSAALLALVLRPAITWPRVLRTAGLCVLGAALDAWALLPDLAYASQPNIAHVDAAGLAAGSAFFDAFSVVFDPLRMVPKLSTTPGLYVQAPDAFLAFGLLGVIGLVARRRDWVALRAGGVLVVLLGTMLSIVLASATGGLPFHLAEVQFPYRLQAYVSLLVGGLVLVVVLRAPGLQKRTWWRSPAGAALLVASAWSLALAGWQLWVPNDAQLASLRQRASAVASAVVPPASYYAYADYGDSSGAYVPTQPNRYLDLAPAYLAPGQTAVTYDLNVPSGFAPIDTDIVASGSFLTISGDVVRVGRDIRGDAVIARRAQATGPVLIVLQETDSAVLTGGRRITVTASLAALALLGALGARDAARWRRRRLAGRRRGAPA